jgi:hypothetical protein
VTLSRLLWFGLAASIVSAPYLASILGHYHATVLNGSPSSWVPSELSADGLPRYLRYLLTPTTVGLVAAVGLIRLTTRLRQKENQLILTAAASALLWFIYSCVVVYAGKSGWRLPPPSCRRFTFCITCARSNRCCSGLVSQKPCEL